MYRVLGLLLLFVPLFCISSMQNEHDTPEKTAPIRTWNAESLPWSTVIIWTERPTGNTLTTGVLINKSKRWVLATRHALESNKPDGTPAGIIDKVYVVWAAAKPDSDELIKTSDHYFRSRRATKWQPARIIAEDSVRDIVILEAGSTPPDISREIALELNAVPSGTQVLGIAQPFTRGGLWHPFHARIQDLVHRRLSYAPPTRRESVALYMATGEYPAEFGYSGSPVVLPYSGKLVGLLLAAQVDNPLSYVLISSQEIQKILPIE